jgi:hypothetical protein
MSELMEWRVRRAQELEAEGEAARATGDIWTAADKWSEAHDVRRGHADPEVEP